MTMMFRNIGLSIALLLSAVVTASAFDAERGAFWSSEQPSVLQHVSVTGRVVMPNGRPIRGARIVLRNDNGQVVSTTYSTTFGYYKIERIVAGEMYVLSVFHKRYLFAFGSQLMEINEDRADVNFIGELNTD